MSKIELLSSRQESLLRTLLYKKDPVSYREISAQFKLSSRTIQREVTLLKPILQDFNLKIVSKMGSGILIEGKLEDKASLDRTLLKVNTFTLYSPEERQEGILFDLLLANEPIKFYSLSDKYGVTESTISHDLDKLEMKCRQNKLAIVRKSGLGVYIDGTDANKRTALSKLLHKDIPFEEWFELFQLSEQEENTIERSHLSQSICKRLQKFMQTTNILKVERAVKEVLQSQTLIQLTDRNYVNLIVHLLLAIERIKHNVDDEVDEKIILPNIEEMREYKVAVVIAAKLEENLGISIPKSEVCYITLHLYGATFSLEDQTSQSISDADMEWYDLTQSLIQSVEKELLVSLGEDGSLFDGLLAHLIPSVNRLKLGLQVHNPMLPEIKQRYPDIFNACQKAAGVLSTRIGKDIPEDEVGYLAVHIGASIIRLKEKKHLIVRAIVVCASGMGTSTYLAAKIEEEIPGLKVESVLSLTELKDKLKGLKHLIISTVTLPFLERDDYILVTPFLSDNEINKIKGRLKDFSSKGDRKVLNHQANLSMVGSARYGEGMVQILRNLNVLKLEESDVFLIDLVEQLRTIPVVTSVEQVFIDLEKRELQGTFVLDNLAMIHAKTPGVSELLVTIYHLEEPTTWDGQEVTAFLLLAAPQHAPKEHIEMMSVISASLIEENFCSVLLQGSEAQIKAKVDAILSSAFAAKIKELLREPTAK